MHELLSDSSSDDVLAGNDDESDDDEPVPIYRPPPREERKKMRRAIWQGIRGGYKADALEMRWKCAGNGNAREYNKREDARAGGARGCAEAS